MYGKSQSNGLVARPVHRLALLMLEVFEGVYIINDDPQISGQSVKPKSE